MGTISTDIFSQKREYFDNGNTKSYEFRIEQLRKLKKAIKDNEADILSALKIDLNKPEFEAYTSEIGFLYEEISLTIKNLKKWMRPKRVNTPLSLMPAKSRIVSEPLGVVLIIGPWNYPFQLLIAPLVGAIAAGNCAILMPSDLTPATSKLTEKIINETFASNYISVVNGPGAIIGPELINNNKFNHIFFTGSEPVGKAIMKMASEHLTPVTLELGGKSPAIVFEDADIKLTAKRVVWGKIFNAGQTCVAPDYLIVHNSIKERLVNEIAIIIKQFLGEEILNNREYTHILNQKRFNKLLSYLENGKILIGGRHNLELLAIEPTVIEYNNSEHPALKEEIFGPILPLLTFEDKEEIIHIVRKNRYPLATYTFTSSVENEKFIINNIEFGGGSINNTIVHLANPSLPFGGVGNSGIGNYHGKRSFEVFSHTKSILKSSTLIDLPMLYPPYSIRNLKIIKYFLG